MHAGQAAGLVVLIVEDDVDLREAMTEALGDAGYRVVHADDGRAALEVLDHHAVSIVIADLAMPGMDGLEFIAAVAASDAGPPLPIVLMTGSQEIKAAPPGSVAVLPKPFSLDALLEVVREYAKPEVV